MAVRRRFIHPETSLVRSKLDRFRGICSRELLDSLLPGTPGALKTRPDGTVLDGHHRLRVLFERGIDIHGLPREVLDEASEMDT